jgi:hypothetical protein
MFSIGQQVVCIDDTWGHPNWKFIPNRPSKGNIYTVRGYGRTSLCETINCPCPRIFLVGITNPIVRWWGSFFEEGSFPEYRFRPVRKTDISIFTAMLKAVPRKALTE